MTKNETPVKRDESTMKTRSSGRGLMALLMTALLMLGVFSLAACEDDKSRFDEAIEEVGDEFDDAKAEIEDEIDDHS